MDIHKMGTSRIETQLEEWEKKRSPSSLDPRSAEIDLRVENRHESFVLCCFAFSTCLGQEQDFW